jgi:hypothetical protein
MQAAITKWNDRAHERAGFGPYLIRTAGRGLSNAAKDLLFAATTRGCGSELLRHAHLNETAAACRSQVVRARSTSGLLTADASGVTLETV